MERIKRYFITIGCMLLTSFFVLLIVSVLTYQFKWKADKALIGIIVTYILAGFAGGFCMRIMQRREYGKEQRIEIVRKAIEAFVISTIFILILVVCSWLRLGISFEFSSRFLLIWLLIMSSSFAGMCVKR